MIKLSGWTQGQSCIYDVSNPQFIFSHVGPRCVVKETGVTTVAASLVMCLGTLYNISVTTCTTWGPRSSSSLSPGTLVEDLALFFPVLLSDFFF